MVLPQAQLARLRFASPHFHFVEIRLSTRSMDAFFCGENFLKKAFPHPPFKNFPKGQFLSLIKFVFLCSPILFGEQTFLFLR